MACYSDRTLDFLLWARGPLFVSTSRGASVSWDVARIDSEGGGPRSVASGDGGVKMAVEGDQLYLASGLRGTNNTITRMGFDGSGRVVVVPSIPPPHWLTVTPTHILYSHDRTVVLLDSRGTYLRPLAFGPSQAIPQWLTVEGDTVFWVDHGIGAPDEVYQGDLMGTPPRSLAGTTIEITAFAACPDALVWASSDQLIRYDRTTQVPDPIMRMKNGVACASDGTLYVTGFGETTASGQEPLAVRSRSPSGEVRVLYTPPQTAGTQVPLQVVATPSHVFFHQRSDTDGAPVHRVLRMPRP